MGERRSIIDAVFAQGDRMFTVPSVARGAKEDPRRIYPVLNLMECVAVEDGESVKQYTVTGNPPEACTGCYFAKSNSTSCSRAPGNRGVVNTGQWKDHLRMLKEARTGQLTDAHGAPISAEGKID